MFMAKWSGGCSMTESINDGGWMHSNLHSLFTSPNFKCKQAFDPPGILYSTLKEYLKDHLTPASFSTYWKCICAMVPFMLKAFSPMTVLSALELVGFDGDKINTKTIMGHNVEFASLDEAVAQNLLGTIDTVFYNYWWKHGLIHENIFDEIFEGEADIDKLSDRVGKPLNELATNRQRFMMDNHECWRNEMTRRKNIEDAKETAKEERRQERLAVIAARPNKLRECSHLGCSNIIDISTPALKRQNEALWSNCVGRNCRIWACNEHTDMLTLHMNTCSKISPEL